MIRFATKPFVLALVSALALSACGNLQDDYRKAFALALTSTFSKKDPNAGRLTQQAVANVLSKSQLPAIVVDLEQRSSQAVMVQIESNGPYRTYANAQRIAVTLRGGMITSTRGVGGDLMSSDVDELLPILQSRSRGIADYTIRFLNGEDITYAYTYTCAVHPGEPTQIVSGVINETGWVTQVVCTGDGPSFTNSYVVANDGLILSARQWMGDFNSFVAVQHVRR